MCNSLEGLQKRQSPEWRPPPAKETSSRPGSAKLCKSVSKPNSRHNPKAIHTSPNEPLQTHATQIDQHRLVVRRVVRMRRIEQRPRRPLLAGKAVPQLCPAALLAPPARPNTPPPAAAIPSGAHGFDHRPIGPLPSARTSLIAPEKHRRSLALGCVSGSSSGCHLTSSASRNFHYNVFCGKLVQRHWTYVESPTKIMHKRANVA